jgi:hypothetical protein
MEGKLVEIAALLLGTDENKTGLMMYSIMNFNVWLNIIDELFALEPKFSGHKSDWTAVSSDLRAINDTRVRLAHHTIWDNPGTTPALRPGKHDAKSKSKKHQPLTGSEVISFSKAVLEAEKKLIPMISAMTMTSLATTFAGGA